jgi:hypothetical protein
MKNLIQVAAVTLLAASTAQAQQAGQWKESDGGNGHWYQLRLAGPISWFDARIQAELLGGHLATLTSGPEKMFAQSVVAQTPGYGESAVRGWGPWLGGYQELGAPDYAEPAGGWRWITAEVWDYAAWPSYQPDNWCVESSLQEHFLSIAGAGLQANGAWNDLPSSGCDNDPVISYVIEWSADCNSDGIVDYGQILQGQLPDTNSNGIPDSCEGPPPDCNGDGIADGIQCRDGSLPDYNGNNVPDCCEQGQPCAVGRYPVQWREDAGGNGHWYLAQRWEGTRSWPQARALAEFVGGYLACVTSTSERAWLHVHAAWDQPGCGPGREGWHIGGFQDTSAPDYAEPSGGWRWVTGEPWVYTAWLTNVPGGDRPNNVGGNEHFLKISELPFAPRWDDVGPGGGQGELCGAVIEWSADCNNDGIVDKGQILLGQLTDLNADGVPDSCQQPSCERADLYPDANINGADLGIMLSQWGAVTPSTRADLSLDGAVDGVDLGILLSYWGICE